MAFAVNVRIYGMAVIKKGQAFLDACPFGGHKCGQVLLFGICLGMDMKEYIWCTNQCDIAIFSVDR